MVLQKILLYDLSPKKLSKGKIEQEGGGMIVPGWTKESMHEVGDNSHLVGVDLSRGI
jgi:hypothetical protein